MEAILGKIVRVRKLKRRRTTPANLQRLEVSFKPACVLPGRAAVPKWLKDQDLIVTRQVADPREVGGAGDSIALSAEESQRWLRPLRVAPAVARGQVPGTLAVSLTWWKDTKPPAYTVAANGRRVTGKFVKDGQGFSASVPTAGLFGGAPSLPAEMRVSVETITAYCTVWPTDGGCGTVYTPRGRQHRIESAWYVLDVCPGGGGGISMLRERGREIDHFAAGPDRIGKPADDGGHFDRALAGAWEGRNRLEEVTMTAAATRREGDATRLCLQGVVDKGKGINTTAACTVFDDLPLVLWRRDLLRHKVEPDKKKDEKDRNKPVEPIDEMVTLAPGFGAAVSIGPDGRTAGRILSVDDDRFAVFRPSHPGDWLRQGWRLRDGWVLAEQPDRRECLLVLFDTRQAPFLEAHLRPRTMRLAVDWPAQAMRPSSGMGFAVAFTAGEACGANVAGAWVACRRATGDGGIECAVIGRFRDRAASPAVTIETAGHRAEASMHPLRLPGVGVLHTALVRLPDEAITSELNITAGDIPARRST